MKSKQNIKPFEFTYQYGRKIKLITKLSGLKQYATVNKLCIYKLLSELGFSFWHREAQLSFYKCRLCHTHLKIDHVNWDRVFLKTCACVVSNKSIMTLNRFKTIYADDEAVIQYNAYVQEKTAKWKPQNPDYSSLSYFTEAYGEKDGLSKYREKNKQHDVTSPDFFQRTHKVDIETAKAMSSERQRTFTLEKLIKKHGGEKGAAIHRERQEKWQRTLKSKPLEEQERINLTKGIGKGKFISKYGEAAWCRKIDGLRASMRRRGWMVSEEEWPIKEAYNRLCRKITDRVKTQITKANNHDHLDHRYSVSMGYRTCIPVEVIASPVNLVYIPKADNIRKSYNCSIKKDELLLLYKAWIETEDGKHYNELINAIRSSFSS